MRHLLNYIIKRHFFFAFLFLEVICFLIIMRSRTYQSAQIFSSCNSLAGNVYTIQSNATQYFSLKEENERLAKKNVELLNMQKSTFDVLPQPKFIKNDTLYRAKWRYILGRVINNTYNKRDNYLTLNIGSEQGVSKDDGVITSNGIVGVVTMVSNNFAVVQSVLHSEFLSNGLVKNDGSSGQMKWDGKSRYYVQLEDIGTSVIMKKGDTIVTSHLTSYFPAGIFVGNIESYSRPSGSVSNTVKVRLSTDFAKLDYVYVVSNLARAEQRALEDSLKKVIQLSKKK